MYVSESKADGVGFTEARKLGGGTWKLNGCPMDGGGIALGKNGEIATAWRREKISFIANPGSDEISVSVNAVRPLVIFTGEEKRVLFEFNGNVMMTKSDGGDLQMVAGNAAFPAAAFIPGKGIMLVWESNQTIKPGIYAEMIGTP